MNVMLYDDKDWILSKEAFLIYASCMYHPTYEDFKKQMEDLLNDPFVSVYVCENQGVKTGMIILKLSDAVAEIIGIAVSEKERRKGIGSNMLQYIMESEDLERIEAQTDDDSIGFYRKCGFAEERIVVEYPDGVAVRYNCVLSK
ncbi:MAG: GNAT family N-acetyltransferase [Ruminococcus sp.]|nr:GNAT family N-acetyltransferase [Ruminococcus sp.]